MENRKTLSKICRQQQSSCCNNSCSMIGITIELFVRQQNFCLITFISPSLHCSAVLYRWICCIAYSLQWSSLLIPVECLNAWYLCNIERYAVSSVHVYLIFDKGWIFMKKDSRLRHCRCSRRSKWVQWVYSLGSGEIVYRSDQISHVQAYIT